MYLVYYLELNYIYNTCNIFKIIPNLSKVITNHFMKHLIVFLLLTSSYFINSQCWYNLSVGSSDCLALKSDGRQWTLGENRHGQLDIGTTADQNIPSQLRLDWKSIETGTLKN